MRPWLTGIAVVSVMVGAALVVRQQSDPRPPRRTARQRAEDARNFRQGMGFGGGLGTPRLQFPFRILNSSRLYPNLGTQVGPTLLTIRQVVPGGDFPYLLNDRVASMKGAINLVLVFQAISPGSTGYSTLALDKRSVEAIDDTGKRLKNILASEDEAPTTGIQNGTVWASALEPPNAEAKFLREVTGMVSVSAPNGTTKRIPIRIESVPLPSIQRLFVQFELLRLSKALPLAKGKLKLAPSPDKRDSSATKVDLGNSETRLVLGAGIENTITLPDSLKIPRWTIRVDPTQGLGYPLTLSVGGQSIGGLLWPQEWIEMKLLGMNGQPYIARFQLVSSINPSPMPDADPTFMAPPGKPSGSIGWQVRVGDRGFGLGSCQFRISQQTGAGWSEPKVANASINAAGEVTLRGIKPGRYRIARLPESVAPVAPPNMPPPPVRDYLRARFGINDGEWSQGVIEVTVRPGARVGAPSLVCQDRVSHPAPLPN